MERQVKILLVEDEFFVAVAMRQRLQSLGFSNCALASNGAEALRQTKEKQPDVVLMDIRLPGGMDGIETAQKIRDYYAIPIIFVSGYTDDATRQRAEQVHPVAYLMKPAQRHELTTAIAHALAEKFKHESSQL